MSGMMLKTLRSLDLHDFIRNVKLANQVFCQLCRENQLIRKDKHIKLADQNRPYSRHVISEAQLPLEVYKWALCVQEYVTTCSNRAESFHRVPNHLVAKNIRKLGLLGCITE